jgi:hypothetical protein
MQNLEPHFRRPGTFIYATPDAGDQQIEFEIEYQMGGTGVFSDYSKARGIYVDITLVHLERREYEGKMHTFRTIRIDIGLPNRGTLILLEELPRKNDKKILRAAEFFDEVAPIVANMWLTDRTSALQLLKDRIAEFKAKYLPVPAVAA